MLTAASPKFAYRTWIRLVIWLVFGLLPAFSLAQWQEGPSSSALSIAYTKDGKYLVEEGNYSFLVFTVATGAVKAIPIQNLNGFSNLIQYWSAPVTWAISPDSKTLAVAELDTASNREVIQFWDLGTGIQAANKPVNSSLTPQSLTYTSDGKTLILGSTSPIQPGTLAWISSSTGAITKSVEIPGPSIGGLTTSRIGLYVAGAELEANGATVYIWYVGSGKLVHTISLPGASAMPSLDFSSDSNSLAIATSSSAASWSVKTGKLVKQVQTSLTVGQWVRFSPDGSTLATLGDGFQVSLYKATTAANVANLNSNQYSSTFAFSFSPDGRTLAVCSGSQYEIGTSIQLWSLASKSITKNLSAYLPVASNSQLYSADHLHLYGAVRNSFNGTKTVQVAQWDPVTGASQAAYDSDLPGGIAAITLSSNGRLLAAVGIKFVNNSITAGVDVWNVATNTKVKSLVFSSIQFGYAIAFTPDSKSLIVAGTTQTGVAIQEIEILTGKTLAAYTFAGSGSVSSIAICSSGNLVVIGYSGKGAVIDLYNLSTHKILGALPTTSTSGVTCVAFSPDGKWIASSGAVPGNSGPPTGYLLGNIEVFDASTLQLLSAQSQQFINQVPTTVLFSADGRSIFSNPVGVMAWTAPRLGPPTTLGSMAGVGFAVSPNRAQVAVVTQGGGIASSALPTGNLVVMKR